MWGIIVEKKRELKADRVKKKSVVKPKVARVEVARVG